MKKLERLKKLLEGNYNFKNRSYKYFPKTNQELKKLIYRLINKYGDDVDLNNIDVSNIKDFNLIFAQRSRFNGNISLWNVSNGKDFKWMFTECYNFNSDLSQWDVSNGENFNYMFFGCYKFNSDLSKWDVSNGKYFSNMFNKCKSFDVDLSKWDVSNAKEWDFFAKDSLLAKYPERIPERFRSGYL